LCFIRGRKLKWGGTLSSGRKGGDLYNEEEDDDDDLTMMNDE
jgi:hypothetical protein